MSKVMPYDYPEDQAKISVSRPNLTRYKQQPDQFKANTLPIFSVLGKFQARWAIVTSILAVFTVFYVPFIVAFTPALAKSMEVLVLVVAIDVLYIFDILLNFRISYLSKYTGDEISSPKAIAWHYLIGGKLLIDCLAAFPFDYFVMAVESTSMVWRTLAFLRIIRIYRLEDMLNHLRARDEAKLMIKFIQLTLFILMYVHVIGCLWFMLVDSNKSWVPPVDLVTHKTNFYYSPAWEQYWFSFYHSVYLLVGVEIMVSNDQEYTFAVGFYIIGAIITAIIVGEMASVSSNLNRKLTRFAEISDNANTTMKNMKLPESLQFKIFDYLLSTHKILEFKEELEAFERLMPPSVQTEVRANIFKDICLGNDLFSKNSDFAEATTRLFKAVFFQPDESVISLGEDSTSMYFISSGKCQVELFDEYKQHALVRYLRPGDYFGELGIIYNTKRTATVKTSVYSNLAQIDKADFKKLLKDFPGVNESFKLQISRYRDPYRCFLKNGLNRIAYLRNLPEPLQDALIYSMETRSYDMNAVIIEEGEDAKIMLVVDGSISVAFKVKSSCSLFRITEEEVFTNGSFQKKRGWSIINGNAVRQRTRSRMFSMINSSNEHHVKLMELGLGSLLGIRQVLVEGQNMLRIKAVEPTTVLVMNYSTITKLAKSHPTLNIQVEHAKRSLIVFDHSCMEYLKRAPIIDCVPMFNELDSLSDKKYTLNRGKVQNAIISVIKRNRELSKGGIPNVKNFVKKLKAIKIAEDKGLISIARDIARGEVDPDVIKAADILDLDEISKPLLNKFAMAAKQSKEAIGTVREHYSNVEDNLTSQDQRISSFAIEVEEFREIVKAFERATVNAHDLDFEYA